jgi:TetR/AcrR family transcriptional regulator, upper aerobic nicotinate degradation pathway regulator
LSAPSPTSKLATKAATKAATRTATRTSTKAVTRDAILAAATQAFAQYGYDGATVGAISSLAASHDRMIYYYFGSKEGLYIAVLEDMYRRMNEAESKLALDTSQPLAALQAVIVFVLRYYRRHPEFITLLNTENLHQGRHITKSSKARDYSSPAIAVIGDILQAGVTQNLFRPDLQARDIYLMIAAMAYFYQSNRYTLSAFLGENLDAPVARAHWQDFVTQAVSRTVLNATQTGVSIGMEDIAP